MDKRSKSSLKFVEIQESVLPEDEWLIGISSLEYFNGVGYSMPSGIRFVGNLPHQGGLLTGGRITADLPQSSNIDDPIRLSNQDSTKDDPLFSNIYRHDDDALLASGTAETNGPSIDTQDQEYLISNMEDNYESKNLYAFIPGIFYCSSQQTSVDAVLIEVTQNQRFGMTLSSFKPEDVRPLDLAQGMMLDENGFGKSIQLSIDTLGSFHSESFLKDSGISQDDVQYCREIELANSLSQWLTLPVLKQAYAASSFLQTRLMKLLDDIEFFGVLPRRRIYVRNEMHPYGSIVETKYQGLDNILDLSNRRGVACPDEIDLEMQLNTLTFSKMLGVGTETDIEEAIMDLISLITEELEGKTAKEEVLKKFTRRAHY
ncbi:hypothetical protein E4H12_03190 [Candidatus Thorarchaeota archaeon]|nr:MAG: hypothetical protein E4H12_03190 [Candidatus Thorarchaeota archaeon]